MRAFLHTLEDVLRQVHDSALLNNILKQVTRLSQSILCPNPTPNPSPGVHPSLPEAMY